MTRTLVSTLHLLRRFGVIGVIVVLALGILVPTTVLAASTSSLRCAAGDVACVIAVGDQDIAVRQTALTTLSGKITAQLNKNTITSDQANALQADVTTNQTGLANLKTTLDAETTMKAARQDVHNIFWEFRIFAVVLPRDYHQLHLDVEINIETKLKNLEPALQQAISTAPAANQAQLNSLFSDFENQVAAAETQITTVQTDLPQFTPENFNTNRAAYETTLANVKAAEKAANQDLHQAGKDLNQITKLLH
jgi:hypothetical protein